MEDTSLDPTEGETSSGDIAVDIDTLAIDGTRPKAGDSVDLKVTGTISSLKDNTAFVTPEMVNDQPIPSDMPETDMSDQAMMAEAQKMDGMPRY